MKIHICIYIDDLIRYYIISTSMIKPASQDVRGAEGSEPAAWSLAASGRPSSAEQRGTSLKKWREMAPLSWEKWHFDVVLLWFYMVLLWFNMFVLCFSVFVISKNVREKCKNEMLISERKCFIYLLSCTSCVCIYIYKYIYIYVHMGEYCIDTCLYIYIYL